MRVRRLHSWNVTYPEAREIQKALSYQLVLRNLAGKVQHVAGTDVSCSKRSHCVWAGVVVLRYPDLELEDEQWVKGSTEFPYIPGLLSFREIPPLLEALKKLTREPDLVLCDGQGIAHPRGLGLASHLGLLIEKPTIGCAKTRLIGEFSEVGSERGNYSPLSYGGRKVGAVVRTKSGVKPLFVSPGYAITTEDAMRMVLNCCGRYRIPEPTRQAHLLVTRLRRLEEAS